MTLRTGTTAAFLTLLLAGSIYLQVRSIEEVGELDTRVQRVEKIVACQDNSGCRAFIRRAIKRFLPDLQERSRNARGGGVDQSGGSPGQQPGPPSGGSPPNPPPPSPLEPVTDEVCRLGVCL